MNNADAAIEWLEFARKDLATAELLSANEGFPEIIAFHCQQAIEKAVNYIANKLASFGFPMKRCPFHRYISGVSNATTAG